MHYVYVKLPASKHSAHGEHVFHEGLEAALTQAQLGGVLGWGASLSRSEAHETAHVAFHRIDIEVTQPELALALLQRTLTDLGAPEGTELHYTLDDADWQNVRGPSGWSERQPSTATPLHRRPAARR